MMRLQDFIGKVVISTATNRRYVLTQITAPYIVAAVEQADARGNRASYRWGTINGDPISTGALVFEDTSLAAPFKAAFSAHCHTRDAYYEEIGYWMRRD